MSFLFRSPSRTNAPTENPPPPSPVTNASTTSTDSSSLTSTVMPTLTAPPSPQPPAPTPAQRDSFLSTPRARKQFLLFGSGFTFLTLSMLLTRRHIRRRLQPPSPTAASSHTRIPPLQTPPTSTLPPPPHPPTTTSTKSSATATTTATATAAAAAESAPPVSGSLEALEALQLASLNVIAFAVTLVGGLSWAYDISTMEELRRKVRGGMGVDGTGRGEQDVEEEFEEWVVSVLARKETKEKMRRAGGGGGGSAGAGDDDDDDDTEGEQRSKPDRQWRVVDEKGRDRTI